MVAFGLQQIYPLLAFLAVALGGAFVWRTGSNRAWRDAAEGWKAEVDLCNHELGRARAVEVELRDTIGELRAVNAKLEALPRVEGLVKLMADTAARQDSSSRKMVEAAVASLSRQLEECERRAEERHKALLGLYREETP